MELGAHLPLIDFGDGPPTLDGLRTYARRVAALEVRYLCANDHLLFARPWLDGPTALAAVLDAAAGVTFATTVALPVIRGPLATAQLLAALHRLSGGRLLAGVGPGSSARDYAAVGIPFEERWRRFDAAVRELRALLPDGPPLWIGSWGSAAGLRRVAALADGWLASAYNTTPAAFAAARRRLAAQLEAAGRPAALPDAIATTWLRVTETRREADRVLDDVLAPMLGRAPEVLRELALPIGPPEHCAEQLRAWAGAGAQRVFLWPVGDELRQLEALRERVVPLLAG